MIRKATYRDLEACVQLAVGIFKTFLEKHGVPVIEQDITNIAIRSISNGQILVVDRDGVKGLTAWEIIPHPANHNLKIFYEIIWCVKSDVKTDALMLLRALEKQAILANVDLMCMATLSDKHETQLNRIFNKQGFNFIEAHYAKRIGE